MGAISNVVYLNEDEDMILITFDDGKTASGPWGSVTGVMQDRVQAWIDDGNSIGAYSDPIDYMQKMRDERNKLLVDTDWTQLSDSPCSASLKADYATYRQDLRDMPQDNPNTTTKTAYDNLTWPTDPGA